ncbi:MAG TPA: 7-carboxy-7-deazaguanine synthase QueE, partial [bacterium]|nr:7-carboxy-7-deazaguanine synthase QueE [bacterium]
LTGGEPLLQVDQKLLLALHEKGYYVALETNGTRVVPDEVDWVCVSPKFGARLVATRGSELKLIYPQEGIDPQGYLDLDFKHFYLQPKDDQLHNQNRERCVAYCLDHPLWKISLQIHKVLGIK